MALRVAGNEVGVPLASHHQQAGDSGNRIELISVMTFDDDAKITSMRAFWSPADVKPL